MHIYWMLAEKEYLFQRDYVDWGHIKIESVEAFRYYVHFVSCIRKIMNKTSE